MAKQIERIVSAERVEDLIAVFGSFDENIKRIEENLKVFDFEISSVYLRNCKFKQVFSQKFGIQTQRC